MIAYLLSVIAGISTPTQTSVNTRLADKVKSPYISSVISFSTATLYLAIILMFVDNGIHLPLTEIAREPFWIWFGGICGVGIVVLNILCLPKLGSALTVMLLSFGQIMTGIIIDSFGLFGSKQIEMTLARGIGAVLVVAGVVMVSKNKEEKRGKNNRVALYIVLAIVCGMCCAFQVAINGRLTVVAGLSWRSTFISMTIGTLGSMVLALGLFLTKGKSAIINEKMPNIKFKWYQLMGGVFAVVIVGSNAISAPVIGAGMVTILNLIGQMSAGLTIDAVGFLGIEKKPITANKVNGILAMIAGTIIIMFM